MDDSAERRVRTTAAHLTAAPCAAIGRTEEGASVAIAVGGSGSAPDDDPYAIEQDFVDLDGIEEIPLVGSDADLSEDYVAGLNMMSQRVDPQTKLGYVDTLESGHVLLVTQPASVRKVLMSSVQHFLGGLRPPSAAFFGAKVLFVLEGQEWLDLRNILKKSFQKSNVKLMSDDVATAADALSNFLSTIADAGGEVDLMQAIGAFHIDAIGRVAFGTDMGAVAAVAAGGEHVAAQSFEYLLEELPRRAYAPDFETQNIYDSDTADNRMMADMSWQVREVVRAAIMERLSNPPATPRQDLLQKMLDAFVEQYPEAEGNADLLTAELGDNLVEIIFAGYNTAVPTTSHALFFLAQHPEIMERARAEVDAVLGGRHATQDDLKQLKFLERVYLETLRLCPPASLIARQLTKDVEMDGLVLPRATRVWIPACAIHRDPDTWERPGEFDPDRFEGKIVRGSFIPFSDGPRSCAGRNFAMFEGVAALAAVLQRFDVTVSDDYDWKTVFTGFGLRPFDMNTARVCMRVNLQHRLQ